MPRFLVRVIEHKPDNFGRVPFFAYWWAPIGPTLTEWGWRGQRFFANVADWEAEQVQRGYDVQYAGSDEELAWAQEEIEAGA